MSSHEQLCTGDKAGSSVRYELRSLRPGSRSHQYRRRCTDRSRARTSWRADVIVTYLLMKLIPIHISEFEPGSGRNFARERIFVGAAVQYLKRERVWVEVVAGKPSFWNDGRASEPSSAIFAMALEENGETGVQNLYERSGRTSTKFIDQLTSVTE
jgi:hypothetical protein